jgi:hypothetical protein
MVAPMNREEARVTSGANSLTQLARCISPKRQGASRPGGLRWPRWVAALGALGVLGVSSVVHSADPPFNFDEFTGNKPFTLNTIWTTPFGPPWADILLKKENFLA